MRLGFTGAHRSGKTTLAGLIAAERGLTRVHSPAGALVKSFGFDMGRDNRLTFERPSVEVPGTTDFGVDMQLAIYDTLIAALEEAPGGYVSDRTPIDVAAYLLADATGYAGSAWRHEQVLALTTRAIIDTERLFDAVILVPPLPIYEEDPSKPPLNPAYQEHHHMLCRGLLFDEDLDVFWDEIRRTTFDLDMRMRFVRGVVAELGEPPIKVAA